MPPSPRAWDWYPQEQCPGRSTAAVAGPSQAAFGWARGCRATWARQFAVTNDPLCPCLVCVRTCEGPARGLRGRVRDRRYLTWHSALPGKGPATHPRFTALASLCLCRPPPTARRHICTMSKSFRSLTHCPRSSSRLP